MISWVVFLFDLSVAAAPPRYLYIHTPIHTSKLGDLKRGAHRGGSVQQSTFLVDEKPLTVPV